MKAIGLLSSTTKLKFKMEKISHSYLETHIKLAKFLTAIAEIEEGIALLDVVSFQQLPESALKKIIHNQKILFILLVGKEQKELKNQFFAEGVNLILSDDMAIQDLEVQIEALLNFLDLFPSGQQSQAILQHQNIMIDQEKKLVFINEQEILLTASEYTILSRMVSHPKRIYGREELLNLVSDNEEGSTTRVIDTHIKNIRKKIEQDSKHPTYIHTVHGRGYRFDPDESA